MKKIFYCLQLDVFMPALIDAYQGMGVGVLFKKQENLTGDFFGQVGEINVSNIQWLTQFISI